MHKETIIAIVVGFGLGFLVAAGIFFLPTMMKKPETTDLPPILTEGKTAPSPKVQLLTVTIPEDYQQVNKDSLIVTGRTKPGSLVVITTVEEDFVMEADLNGNFEQEVSLSLGTQEIVATAFFPDGEHETVKRLVLYFAYES